MLVTCFQTAPPPQTRECSEGPRRRGWGCLGTRMWWPQKGSPPLGPAGMAGRRGKGWFDRIRTRGLSWLDRRLGWWFDQRLGSRAGRKLGLGFDRIRMHYSARTWGRRQRRRGRGMGVDRIRGWPGGLRMQGETADRKRRWMCRRGRGGRRQQRGWGLERMGLQRERLGFVGRTGWVWIAVVGRRCCQLAPATPALNPLQ